MKAAILVSGQMAALDMCAPSIRRHLLDRLGMEFEVLAHICDDRNAWKIKLLNPTEVSVVKTPEFDEKNYVHRTGRGTSAVQPLLRSLWSMDEINRMKKAAEVRTGARYDWVFHLRGDTQFFNDIEPLSVCDPDAVHLPGFGNCWGLQCRFAFGGSKVMETYLGGAALLDLYVSEGGIFHPESFCKWVLEREGVKIGRTGILFDTVYPDGERIRPAWNPSQGDIPPDWKLSLIN